VQNRSAFPPRQSGGDVDDVAPLGGPAGYRVQVVGDRGPQDPGRVGAETPGGHVGQGTVDEVGEYGFDDGATAVDDVGGVDGFLRVV